MMKEFIKKGFLIGIGMGELAKEKVEKTINELVRKGKISKGEGKKLAKKMLAEQKRFNQELKREIKKSIEKIWGVAKQEIKRINERVKKFEAQQKKKIKPKKKIKKKKKSST